MVDKDLVVKVKIGLEDFNFICKFYGCKCKWFNDVKVLLI